MSNSEQSVEIEAIPQIEQTENSSLEVDQKNVLSDSIEKPTIENDRIESTEEETSKLTVETDKKLTPSDVEEPDYHVIKWIDFNYEILPILLQNANGPCPLLAIFNILLLRKRITLNSNTNAISTRRVLSLLAEYILEKDISKLSDEERANYEHNVQDAIAVLDKIQTGLDVNLKFDGVDQFEYTRECVIFDLCNISLYHGWLIDPQDKQLRKIIEKNASSYNQLIEKMISQRHSDNEELVRESLLIEQFFDENRSQLTHFGILQLNETMRDNQLAVFFRNNHFSTIWKHQNQLFVLVSDQGYLDHESIVFETLTDVDNDTQFTDGYGRIWQKRKPEDSSQDRELAIAMQNEEERQYREAQIQQQQQQQQQTQDSSNPKKNKNRSKKPLEEKEDKACVIS